MQYRNLNNQKDANTDITIARKKIFKWTFALYFRNYIFFHQKFVLNMRIPLNVWVSFRQGPLKWLRMFQAEMLPLCPAIPLVCSDLW